MLKLMNAWLELLIVMAAMLVLSVLVTVIFNLTAEALLCMTLAVLGGLITVGVYVIVKGGK